MKKGQPPASRKTKTRAGDVSPERTASRDPLEIRRQLRQMVWQKTGRAEEAKRDPREQYLYLLDGYLRERPYQKILSGVEARLNDFEIVGKMVRLSAFANPRTVIEDEMRHGAKNVIIAGNDETLARILTRAADLDVTFGFLPIGQRKNYLAKVLGLPLNEDAVEAVAARKIEKIDYGTINKNRFFLSYLYIPATSVRIECDKIFSIKPGREKYEMAVANLLPPPFDSEKFVLHPQDGQMEFYFKPAAAGLFSSLVRGRSEAKISIFPFRHLLLASTKPMTVLADGKESQELNVEVEVAKKKLRMIVGKGRQF